MVAAALCRQMLAFVGLTKRPTEALYRPLQKLHLTKKL